MVVLVKLALWAGGLFLGRAALRAALDVPKAAPLPPSEPPAPTEPVETEIRAVDRQLAWSSGAALASVAAAVVPPLGLLAVPGVLVPLVPLLRRSWIEVRDQGRLTLGGLDALTASAALLTGHAGLCALGLATFFGGRRLALAGRRREGGDALDPEEGRAPVWVLRGEVEQKTPLSGVLPGDRIRIRAGEAVPCDGLIEQGALLLDERARTGEARILERWPGDRLVAGGFVKGGSGLLVAERAGAELLADRRRQREAALRSVEQQVQEHAARVGDASVGPTLAMGAIGLVAGGAPGALAGLWSSCVDVLWVSAPLASHALVGAAGRAGIRIHDARSLELLGDIDTVVFDKTGTLTLETLSVVAVHPALGLDEAEVLRLAAEAERWQTHPIARAILGAAETAALTLSAQGPGALVVEEGLGLVGAAEDGGLRVGSRRLLGRAGLTPPPEVVEALHGAEARGDSVVYVSLLGAVLGAIVLQPELRPEVPALMDRLAARGLELHLLSGDDVAPTETLARRLGVARWRAAALPEDKSAYVAALQAGGRRVLFVGDGINDALAMRAASVSVAVAGGAELALRAAQILLGEGDLGRVEDLLELGARTRRTAGRLLDAAVIPTAANVLGVLSLGLGLTGVTLIYVGAMGAGLLVAAGEGAWAPAAGAGGRANDPTRKESR